MKISINTILSISVCVLALGALSIPQQSMAQRFSHGGGGGGGMRGGGGGGFHPAPAPAPRPTINGGSRNVGNHDFSRANTVAARPVVRSTVAARPAVHENVNVYHSGSRGVVRAYGYHAHPYHPYYWGAGWHPIGFFLSSLAADAFYFSLANQAYYYDDGVYYSPYNGGYAAVAAPIGAVVSSLPAGYETVQVGDDYYYYYGGTFYINNGQGYQVVVAPIGAVVTQIPDGAVDQQINGQDYLVYNNTYFQPVSADGQDAYQVVQVN
jgi:Family of unknown function (DUF6515)